MGKSYGNLARQAEQAVRGIRDKELRREAFRILLLQLMAGGKVSSSAGRGRPRAAKKKRRGPGRPPKKRAAGRPRKKAAKRPGRRGGGVVTTGLNKLVSAGYFRTDRDAATVFKEFRKRRINIEPSQLRMELLRFARSRKLKRRVKMKGRKVTYLYRR